MRTGKPEGRIPEYFRDGIVSLFAALYNRTGDVLGKCYRRHRAKEFLTFLRRIDRAVLKPRDIHLVLDNYATHKTPEVKAWLDKHPRFKLHFTPTSASWLNMVERFFRDLTVNRLRRSIFKSLDELLIAIETYLADHNRSPNPFIWTAKASDILAKVQRARSSLKNK